MAWEVAPYSSEKVSMHPKHPLATVLKLLLDVHVELSELGIPDGDLHFIAGSL